MALTQEESRILQAEPVFWEPECASDKIQPWCVVVACSHFNMSVVGITTAVVSCGGVIAIDSAEASFRRCSVRHAQLLRGWRRMRAVLLLLLRRPRAAVNPDSPDVKNRKNGACALFPFPSNAKQNPARCTRCAAQQHSRYLSRSRSCISVVSGQDNPSTRWRRTREGTLNQK